MLDEVIVEIEALEEPRPPPSASTPSYRTSTGKYGLIDRVVDGMLINVNSVHIVFCALAFKASIELSRLSVISKMPNWKDADLKLTYIRDTGRDQILLFKELVWETTRIEANGLQDIQVTPVRLIANTSRIRITLKKKLSDCSILGSRVQMILDDLLWVLTVSQLEAAILFIKSLQMSIAKSAKQAKTTVQDKLNCQSSTVEQHRHSVSGTQSASNTPSHRSAQMQLRKLFDKYDVPETSYHLHTGRVDLHFCEEGQPDTKLSKNAVAAGAIQVTLFKLALDFYPFHNSDSDRSHWLGYTDNAQRRNKWAESILEEHWKGQTDFPKVQAPTIQASQRLGHCAVIPARPQLMESAFVIRLDDVHMSCVTTNINQKDKSKAPFFASDKARLKLPVEMTTIHMDYTEYYYPDASKMPAAPASTVFLVTNPLHLRLDFETLVWLNAFILNISKNLAEVLPESAAQTLDSQPLNFRWEALMSRLILPSEMNISGQPERPDALQIIINNLVLCNTDAQSQSAELSAVAQRYRETRAGFFRQKDSFPHTMEDPQPRWQAFWPTEHPAEPTTNQQQLWCLQCQQVWCEFTGIKANRCRPVTFMDNVPLSLWLHSVDVASGSFLSIITDVGGKVALQLTHFQYLFLLRLVESFSKLALQLDEDTVQLMDTPSKEMKLVLAVTAHDITLSMVMPALSEVDGSVECESPPLLPCSDSEENMEPSVEEMSSMLPPSVPVRKDSPALTCDLSCCPPSDSSDSLQGIAMSVPARASPVPRTVSRERAGRPANSTFAKIGSSFTKLGERVRAVAGSDVGSDADLDDWVSVAGSDLSWDEDQLLSVLDAEHNSDIISGSLPAWAEPGHEVRPDSPMSAGSVTSRGRDIISVVAFKLEGLDCLVSTEKEKALVILAVDALSVDETGNRVMDEMSASYAGSSSAGSNCHGPPEFTTENGRVPVAALRIVMLDDSTLESAEEKGSMSILASRWKSTLMMSSVMHLAEFVEDELLVPGLPMFLELRDLQLNLREDRPCPNLACPGHMPLRLDLPRLRIYREPDNTIHLLPPDNNAPQSVCNGLVTKPMICSQCKCSSGDQQLSQQSIAEKEAAKKAQKLLDLYYLENVKLREQIASMREENLKSNQLSQELALCQEEVVLLKQERDSLLATMLMLQNEVHQMSGRSHSRPPPPPAHGSHKPF